ncbi:type II and III secretion system protein [Stieleria varia]|uniref:Bacterial type II and III secretion system protein n=1 Tax=Stieleria varia TaxID=2528005 RepID=A0A5C6B1Z8_9BACT|nr:type II and III secretion system protein [Stieleria varia]TWU05591.1 Bacterial type II and III secretion system protein [Stieleria varia]
MHPLPSLRHAAAIAAVIFAASPTFAQQSIPPFTESVQQASAREPATGTLPDPAEATSEIPPSSGPFASAPTGATATTIAAQALARSRMKHDTTSVLIDMEILSIQPDLRVKWYERIGTNNINTTFTRIPETKHNDIDGSPISNSRQTCTYIPGTISTATITADDQKQLREEVRQSAVSRIIATPRVITNDHVPATISDVQQRPFLTDLTRENGIQSDIQVLDEGTEIGVCPSVNVESIELDVFLRTALVKQVTTQRVFGISDGETIVQVPELQTTSLQTHHDLRPGEVLLIDPYIEVAAQPKADAEPGILKKLPSIVSTFRSETPQQSPNQMMILIRAKLVQPQVKQANAER